MNKSRYILLTFIPLLTILLILPKIYSETQYVGVNKCKKCHISKKKGAQYKVWSKMKHSKAYETLAKEESLKIAKEKGLKDALQGDQCIKCHITGHGLPKILFSKKFDITKGVQCESCHGAGEKHVVKRELSKKEKKKTGKELPISKDEIIRKPTKETCLKCHNDKSPHYKEFDFEKMFKKISHLKPTK
jgi:hypothetical protein